MSQVNEDKSSLNFLDVILILEKKLKSFKAALANRDGDELNNLASDILVLSQSILSFCLIFMDYVHPIWIQFKRSGMMDQSKLDDLKSKMDQKLETNSNRLMKEYQDITKENSA